jgi:hypothetical protein
MCAGTIKLDLKVIDNGYVKGIELTQNHAHFWALVLVTGKFLNFGRRQFTEVTM